MLLIAFDIMIEWWLKEVKGNDTCYLPFIQFEEQKDQVIVERILRVVFLNAERPSPVS